MVESDMKKALECAKSKLRGLSDRRKGIIGDINNVKNKSDEVKKMV